jgi:uncharacterized FAD-dependent dehydrogenase
VEYYGAPSTILVHGSPHYLGTDNLVKLLRAMRLDLRRLGGEIIFGTKMTQLVVGETSRVTKGVQFIQTQNAMERHVNHNNHDTIEPLLMVDDNPNNKNNGPVKTLLGDAVVLATGHSARDVY